MATFGDVIAWKVPTATWTLRQTDAGYRVENWVHPTVPSPTQTDLDQWRLEYVAAGGDIEKETNGIFQDRKFRITLRLIQQLHNLTGPQIRAMVRDIVERM